MYYKSRKLSAARQRIKDELIALGWTEKPCHYPANGKIDLYSKYNSPHIDDTFFWYENSLKRINSGEAYYALETFARELSHLSWRCDTKNPNNHEPLDTLDAYEEARCMMLNGIDFNYYLNEDEIPEDEKPEDYSGHINIIDWEHPERNTFYFVEGWRGAQNDGFAWDIILCVNAIPVGAILLEADDKDSDAAPIQKALDVAQSQLDADFQFPVYCHSFLLSNGKQMLYGDPWMELEDFTPISSLAEGLKPLDFLEHRIRTIEQIED